MSIMVLLLKCRWRFVNGNSEMPKGGQSLSLPRPLLQWRFKYLDDFCTLLIVTADATQREIFVELIRDGINSNFDFLLILIFHEKIFECQFIINWHLKFEESRFEFSSCGREWGIFLYFHSGEVVQFDFANLVQL